jgi:serine/threonine protein kinase
VNLYELIKQNHFKGLSTNLVRVFSTQLLDTLSITKANQIIHCDLKPENILLKSLDSPAIKVIDFGSACQEAQQTYTYIQSRFYRSPEVLLGLRYTTAIDMWSFGCIVAELYLGLPLFPGSSEYNQLSRIIEAAGNIPDHMIISGKHGHRYFNRSSRSSKDQQEQEYHYSLKDIKQYSEERKKNERPSKRYFSTFNLDELVLKYPMPKKNMSEKEKAKELKIRSFLLDFLKKVLQVDPLKRLTPKEALKHPFISGLIDNQHDIEKEEEEIISLGNKMMKKKLKEKKQGDDLEEEEEEEPLMLTGVRRKSFANKESRSSTSISPYSRKRYGSILSPLLSPPIDAEEEKNQDQQEQCMFSQLDNSHETKLRCRYSNR